MPSAVTSRAEEVRMRNATAWRNKQTVRQALEAEDITKYVETFNPVVAARGFGMLDQLVGGEA